MTEVPVNGGIAQKLATCFNIIELNYPIYAYVRDARVCLHWVRKTLANLDIKLYRVGQKNGATLFFRNTAQICTIFCRNQSRLILNTKT